MADLTRNVQSLTSPDHAVREAALLELSKKREDYPDLAPLLADPNTLSPANMVASNIFRDNKILYEQKVREVVEKSLDNAVD
jgi:hypothetical protein